MKLLIDLRPEFLKQKEFLKNKLKEFLTQEFPEMEIYEDEETFNDDTDLFSFGDKFYFYLSNKIEINRFEGEYQLVVLISESREDVVEVPDSEKDFEKFWDYCLQNRISRYDVVDDFDHLKKLIQENV